MIVYKPGDVVLVKFPFTSGTGSKLRPALVILDTGDADLVVARITTQSNISPFDVPLMDWRGAGLLAPSNARLHKLATLEKSDIQRTLGCLQAADRQSIAVVLRRAIDTW
jgi:mRNA interferase MazF